MVQVHDRLCRGPKEDPAAALPYAIAFEEGLRRQRQLVTQARLQRSKKNRCLWFLVENVEENAGDVVQEFSLLHI